MQKRSTLGAYFLDHVRFVQKYTIFWGIPTFVHLKRGVFALVFVC